VNGGESRKILGKKKIGIEKMKELKRVIAGPRNKKKWFALL
jgi:hypothetical protein